MGNKGTASYLDIRYSTIYTNKGPVLYPLETGLYHHNDGGSSKNWRWRGILDTIHDDNDNDDYLNLHFILNDNDDSMKRV